MGHPAVMALADQLGVTICDRCGGWAGEGVWRPGVDGAARGSGGKLDCSGARSARGLSLRWLGLSSLLYLVIATIKVKAGFSTARLTMRL